MKSNLQRSSVQLSETGWRRKKLRITPVFSETTVHIKPRDEILFYVEHSIEKLISRAPRSVDKSANRADKKRTSNDPTRLVIRVQKL